MEVYNPNAMEAESVYRFNLKQGQVVTNLQLDLNGKYRNGSIEERWKANNAYNSIVGKRVDPALLQMEGTDQYRLNVYPVPAYGSRWITFTIEENTFFFGDKYMYSLPLRAENIQHLSITASAPAGSRAHGEKGMMQSVLFSDNVSNMSASLKQQNKNIGDDIAFSFYSHKRVECFNAFNGKHYFSLKPNTRYGQLLKLQSDDVVVYWDASASLQNRNTEREMLFLKQFVQYHHCLLYTSPSPRD